jgi:hypothetical protein
MIAGELLRFHDAVHYFEGDVVNNDVEEMLWREYATDQHLEFGAPGVFQYRTIDGAPRREAVEAGRERTKASLDTVTDNQDLIESEELRDLSSIVPELRIRTLQRRLGVRRVLQRQES